MTQAITNYVCERCAEANNGVFRKDRNRIVQLYLGHCDGCGELTGVTNTAYWQNISSTQKCTPYHEVKKRTRGVEQKPKAAAVKAPKAKLEPIEVEDIL